MSESTGSGVDSRSADATCRASGSPPGPDRIPGGPGARATVECIEASRIREVFDYGQQFADVIPLWFGEPDVVTPAFIRNAAKDALDAGETFYASNLGIPELRAAIAAYLTRWRRPVDPSTVVVTSSGVSALALAAQTLVEPRDRVVVVDPVWPNLAEIPKILGAQVERFSLRMSEGRWGLDLDRLLANLDAGVRVLWINSPGNPTGFVLDHPEIEAILSRCRETGTWIVSDDVYDRLCYDRPIAPSFLDVSVPEDRLLAVNSFSKSWAMTGWRLGWIVAPRELVPQIAKLVEYNTSCAPVFLQRAAVVALDAGEPFVAETVTRYRAARDYIHAAISALPGVEAALPAGAMYLFFRVAGERDSLALAKRLVAQARVGLAPGIAFGPAGEGHLRLCFASSQARLESAVERLAAALAGGR